MNLCKEEQLKILKRLLEIADILDKCGIMVADDDDDFVLADDKERYLEMMTRINPSDPGILWRKREYNLYYINHCRKDN